LSNKKLEAFIHYLLNLSVGAKARILLSATIIGMLLIGVISGLMLFGIKNSFDDTFYTRTISISKLQAIKDVHTLNILNTYRDVLDSDTQIEDSYEVLDVLQKNMEYRWLEYVASKTERQKNNFFDHINTLILSITSAQTPNSIVMNEKEIQDKASLNIEKLIVELGRTTALYKKGDRAKAEESIRSSLFSIIDSTNIYLEQLINYHLQKALFEKEKADALFGLAVWIVFGLALFVLIVSAALAYLILENIKNLHSSLEIKVAEKTKELVELNKSLEIRIGEEIKKSRLKDELLHRQAKLASMGEMIANIAHQWRQPLNALTMLIQNFEIKSMAGKLTPEFISKQTIEGLALSKNMSDTIEEFRNYFKPDKEFVSFSLKKAVDDAIFLIEGAINRAEIKICVVCDESLCVVGSKNSFAQVLINLLNNSIDALGASDATDRRIYLKLSQKEVNNERRVILRAIDNGGGINREALKRLFEPYFTTKHQASGTGIGLYMSKKIIQEQFNGSTCAKNIRLTFDNSRYNCAMFKIIIPLRKERDGVS